MASYIRFTSVYAPKRKTQLLTVSSTSGAHLGHISWFARWRQYCFFPAAATVFSVDCMLDISNKVGELTRGHREGGRHG